MNMAVLVTLYLMIMLEQDFFGYAYIRPPNYVVAGIIEDWQQGHFPISVLCAKYVIDELTCRNIIHEVLYTKVMKSRTILIMSKV